MWIVDDSKELNNMVSTMNSHTVDGGSPVRHRKISVARSAAYQEARGTENNREVVAVAINTYMMNNVEHVRHTAT